MHLSSLFFVTSAVLIPQTHAWGTVGHEVVATIAQMHLHPTVMPKICDILLPHDDDGDADLGPSGEFKCHLAPVATWADRVRNLPRYRWTGPLHYIGAVDDYPSATCAFPGSQGWEGRTHINVLHAIRNTTTVLQAFEGARSLGARVRDGGGGSGDGDPDSDVPEYVQDALKFLIHFIGDMHMPLHLTGRHRGGNDDKVAFDGRTTNLHSVWDTLLISEHVRTLPRNYTRVLPILDVEAHLRDTIYDPYIRRIVWEGVLDKWQDELDGWIACPSSSDGTSASASAWQTVLSLFSLGREEGEGEDGGLGVDDNTLCPYAWAKPIHQLNCQVVYPRELEFSSSSTEIEEKYDADVEATGRRRSPYLELYTPDYAGLIKEQWIIEKLLTQAAIRLAAVLNWIFAELDEDEIRSAHITL